MSVTRLLSNLCLARFWHAEVQFRDSSKYPTGMPEVCTGEVIWEGSQNYQVTEISA